jgi:hypothetical protein
LVVNSATADSHLQVVGANSPSIRIDNAGSGGTQRFVFGLATATNNFIQGAAAGQFCISTQSAGAMLFGMWQTTNASEVMRISTANNLIVGSTADNGSRFQVSGAATFSSTVTAANSIFNSTTQAISASSGGYIIAAGRIGGSNGGNIFSNNGTGTNFIIAETGTNIFAIGGGALGGAFNGIGITLNTSTGAATFSSSVTAGTYLLSLGQLPAIVPSSTFIDYITTSPNTGRFAAVSNATNTYPIIVFAQYSSNGSLGRDAMRIYETGNVCINTTFDSGQKLYLNGSLRIDGQSSGTAGILSGQYLIINLDGNSYKIALFNP